MQLHKSVIYGVVIYTDESCEHTVATIYTDESCDGDLLDRSSSGERGFFVCRSKISSIELYVHVIM